MKKSQPSAFTLIELLVVISIIAVLTGIALPVFASTREKGNAVSCASGLRQIGMGTQVYLNDNDDTWLSGSWPATLQAKYVTDWRVFKSAFDTRNSTLSATNYSVSYGINKDIAGKSGAKVGSPSRLIVYAPTAYLDTAKVAFTGTSSIPLTIDPTALPTAASLGTHAKRSLINAAYADGHVAALKWSTFSDAASATNAPVFKGQWFSDGAALSAP